MIEYNLNLHVNDYFNGRNNSHLASLSQGPKFLAQVYYDMPEQAWCSIEGGSFLGAGDNTPTLREGHRKVTKVHQCPLLLRARSFGLISFQWTVQTFINHPNTSVIVYLSVGILT